MQAKHALCVNECRGYGAVVCMCLRVAGWVGLSSFPLILGKVQVPPQGCPLFWVGGWVGGCVAALGRPPTLFMGRGTL